MPITPEGLVTRRQPEILDELVADERQLIHPDISTRDDGLLGQINQIVSLKASEVEDTVQACYDSRDLDLAEGLWLDKLAREKGLARQADAYSTTPSQRFIGKEGTVVSAGTIVKSTISGKEFSLVSELTLTSTACIALTYSVNTLLNSTAYSVTINSIIYTFNSDVDATELEILNGLEALITADVTATWSAVVNVSTLYITTDALPVTINVSATSYLAVDSVELYGSLVANEYGPEKSPAGSVTDLVTSVPGVLSTTNDVDVVEGRYRELDAEFRSRIYDTRVFRSVATLPAIVGRLRNVTGVTAVSIIENTTSVTDGEGRPAHHYEVIVLGGVDADVANEIWLTKPAGIGTYGNTTSIINDSDGIPRSMNYSRPVAINIAFRITYTVYAEETVPVNIDTLIKNAITGSIGGLGIDVIPHRYYGPIFSATTGVESLIVEIQEITTSGDVPNPGGWLTVPLSIITAEYASTADIDITIVAA